MTNHAVVAMIEEDVKQTRCTTCDAEHAYKGARVPKRRKKDTPAGLYKEVLAGLTDGDGADAGVAAAGVPMAIPAPPAPPDDASLLAAAGDDVDDADERIDAEAAIEDDEPEGLVRRDVPGILRQRVADDARQPEPRLAAFEPADEPPQAAPVVDGPVHRPLIRATLPRPEGQKDARPLPEFTIRQAPSRGNGHGNGHHGHGNGQGGNAFRGERMRARGNGGAGQGNGHGGNGNRPHAGPRFHGGSGNRPQGGGRNPMGRGGGPPSGFRNGNGGPNGKRGRGSRG